MQISIGREACPERSETESREAQEEEQKATESFFKNSGYTEIPP
jgi:hypothetical protein